MIRPGRLSALLLCFFDPQQGRITIGGIDARDLKLDSLRGQIAVVAQDTYLFYGTIADNLRLPSRRRPRRSWSPRPGRERALLHRRAA